MNVPVTYTPGFVADPLEAFNALWSELAWGRRGLTPRREYYCNEFGVPYTYGMGEFARTYDARPWHPTILTLKAGVERAADCAMEVCFLNGYENARDHLGWHADDSPEMDDARPIAIVTLGAEREIWFRPNEEPDSVTRLLLGSGSLRLMAAGMQDSHMHRMPKAECGPRIASPSEATSSTPDRLERRSGAGDRRWRLLSGGRLASDAELFQRLAGGQRVGQPARALSHANPGVALAVLVLHALGGSRTLLGDCLPSSAGSLHANAGFAPGLTAEAQVRGGQTVLADRDLDALDHFAGFLLAQCVGLLLELRDVFLQLGI